jgi:hypothetical protein
MATLERQEELCNVVYLEVSSVFVDSLSSFSLFPLGFFGTLHIELRAVVLIFFDHHA